MRTTTYFKDAGDARDRRCPFYVQLSDLDEDEDYQSDSSEFIREQLKTKATKARLFSNTVIIEDHPAHENIV